MPTWAFFCSEPECGPGPELEYQTLRLWPHRVHGPRLSVPQKCAEHLQHQQVWITLILTLVWLDHGLWQYHFLIWFCDSICALHSPRKERISPRRIMVDRLATWLQRLPSDAFPLPSYSIFSVHDFIEAWDTVLQLLVHRLLKSDTCLHWKYSMEFIFHSGPWVQNVYRKVHRA